MKWNFWKRKKEDHATDMASFFLPWADYLSGNSSIGTDFDSMAREAYRKNVIAFVAIFRIASAVADIPYLVMVNGKEVDRKHPIAKLLRRPNIMQGYKAFMREILTHRLISGNNYVRATVSSGGKLLELKAIRPSNIKYRITQDGVPTGFEWTLNGKVMFFPIDPFTWDSEVLHMKDPNPVDDLYGMSPIRAAALGIEQHNESSNWNKKLLENMAKPEGIMTLKSNGAGTVAPSNEQLDKLAKDWDEKYARKPGKVAWVNFAMEFQKLGMSPSDMDWINGKNTSARDIALGIGYPPHLLGMAEGSTFNNVAEAKLSFYLETVLPRTRETHEDLSTFLSQKTKVDVEITQDLDQVEALAPVRERITKESREDFSAGIITLNEARALRKYDELPNGDDVLIPAGKVPLSFDPSNLNDEEFKAYLKGEGVSEEMAGDLVALTQ